MRIIRATLRLFVAIEVNEAVRALARETSAELVRAGVTGRYESPEKLHVTVAFLGTVADGELAQVSEAFQGSWPLGGFCLDFDRLGAFPSLHRPRVVWLGSAQPNRDFAECARRVRAAFAQLGFTFDHDPQAHVTLCRLKGQRLDALPALARSARLPVNGLTLFQSLPAGPTTRYEAIARTPMQPTRATM